VPKKLLIVALPLLAAGLVAFKMFGPKEEEPRAKIDGDVYVMPKDFLVNLEDDRFAKLSVALVLEHGQGAEAAAGEAEEAGAEPPQGYGPLPQEALVRTIVTDTLTGQPAARLRSRMWRKALKKRIQEALERSTDVHALDVLFPDVAVQ
jgi:flagellar basal body-associated protein FliL